LGFGRALTLCAALLLGGLVPSVALADDYDDALRDGAAARDVARETHRPADWQRALSHFERAVAIADTMAARFELAEAAHGLGWTDVAYASYELALEKGLFGKAASVAKDYLAAHRSDVARVALTAPAGTTVYVDGRERAKLPLDRPLVVPAGNVRLRLVAADHEPWEQAVDLDAQVVMRLAPEFEPPPPEVTLPPPEVTLPPPPPADSGSFLAEPGSVVLLSLAVVSLISGGILAYEWQDTEDEVEDTRSQITAALGEYAGAGYFGVNTVPCGPNGVANGVATFDSMFPASERSRLVGQFASACDRFEQQRARADRFQTATYIAFGTTAAASLTLLGLYLFDGDAEPEADRADDGPRIVPVLGSDTQGVLLNMRF
jgi:hypothetical protein